jgi:rubredoxin
MFPGKLSDAWVPVAKIGGLNARMEAEMIESYLRSQDITVRLFNDHTAGWMPVYAAFIPIRVCVLPDQVEEARALLAQHELHDPDADADSEINSDDDGGGADDYTADAVCPQCGSGQLQHGKASLLFSALSLLLLAIPLVMRLSAWECRDCGWKGRSSDLY